MIKEEEGCTYAINPIQPGIDEMTSVIGKALLKEIIGYNFFKMHVGSNVTYQEITMACQDGDLIMKYNESDYTEEEKLDLNRIIFA